MSWREVGDAGPSPPGWHSSPGRPRWRRPPPAPARRQVQHEPHARPSSASGGRPSARGVDRARRRVQPPGDPQLGRARARVGRDLVRVRHDRLARRQREARRLGRAPPARGGSRAARRRSGAAGSASRSRSSSEWKVTTASQPPGASAASAAARPRASSPSSSLTAIRSAWKLRVAACGWPGFGRGSSRSISPASCSVVANGARRAVGDDGPGDPPRGALLAVAGRGCRRAPPRAAR